MAPYAVSARLSLPRLLEASATTAPGGDPTRSGAASAMAPYAASARLPLPRLLETAAATAPGGDPTRAGAASAMAPYAASTRLPLPRLLEAASATAPGGDPTRAGAASAMAPYAALARLPLPRLLEIAATTAPGGDPTRAGATSRDARGRPEVHLACKSKAAFSHSTQGTDSYHDPKNSRLFVGCHDQSIIVDDLLANVEVLARKGGYGFVTYSNWALAEEAMIMLNGSQLGDNTMRLWGYSSANKQQDRQNDGRYERLKCFDPSGFGWSPQLGNFNRKMMNAAYSSTLKNDDPNVATLMAAGLVLRRGFSGTSCGNGSPKSEKQFWHRVERQTHSKLDRRSLPGMVWYGRMPTLPRIFIYAVAFNGFCQAC
ncbi:unnamed protein product [Urochloa humidicola]